MSYNWGSQDSPDPFLVSNTSGTYLLAPCLPKATWLVTEAGSLYFSQLTGSPFLAVCAASPPPGPHPHPQLSLLLCPSLGCSHPSVSLPAVALPCLSYAVSWLRGGPRSLVTMG